MVCKYSHGAGYEQRYGIDELGGFQPCSSRMQCGRIFMLVRSKFIVICFALSSECDLRNCLYRGFLLRILRVSFLCASCEMPEMSFGCFDLCIRRDALLCASFEVLFLCILRGALLCASFEVLCFVHHSRRRSLGFCFFLEKRLPPS